MPDFISPEEIQDDSPDVLDEYQEEGCDWWGDNEEEW
jgi:hypothetical protein